MKKLKYSTDTFFISVSKYNKEETITEEIEVNVYIRFFERKQLAFGEVDCISNSTDTILDFIADAIKFTSVSTEFILDILIFYADNFDTVEAYCGDGCISFYDPSTDITTTYQLFL